MENENKNFGDVVRAIFPDATDDEVEILLWEHTPFPHAGEPYVSNALKVLKATLDADEKPCFDCNKPAVVFGKVFNYCAECNQDAPTVTF